MHIHRRQGPNQVTALLMVLGFLTLSSIVHKLHTRTCIKGSLKVLGACSACMHDMDCRAQARVACPWSALP